MCNGYNAPPLSSLTWSVYYVVHNKVLLRGEEAFARREREDGSPFRGSLLLTTQPFSAIQLGSICVCVGWTPELHECWLLAIFPLAFLLQRSLDWVHVTSQVDGFLRWNGHFYAFSCRICLSAFLSYPPLADLCPSWLVTVTFPSSILYHWMMKRRKVGPLSTGYQKQRPKCTLQSVRSRQLKTACFVLLGKWMSPYVPFTENTFCSGDHISWHSPLDNSESRIQHMLLTEDPQMQPVQTPFGSVSFLQVGSNMRYSHSHTFTFPVRGDALYGLRPFYVTSCWIVPGLWSCSLQTKPFVTFCQYGIMVANIDRKYRTHTFMLCTLSCRLWASVQRSSRQHNNGTARASWSWCAESECECMRATTLLYDHHSDAFRFLNNTILFPCFWIAVLL